MTDANAIDLALLLIRACMGGIMLAHGINHVFGGGKIEGTASWFGSMGMRPPLVHAWLASIAEIGAGVLLVLGLFTPLAYAAVAGVMTVAFAINHRGNGFFIFRPGEGWEYVISLLVFSVGLGAIGAGSWSLDNAFGIDDDLLGMTGLLITIIAGIGGGIALLAAFWRPEPSTED